MTCAQTQQFRACTTFAFSAAQESIPLGQVRQTKTHAQIALPANTWRQKATMPNKIVSHAQKASIQP